MLKFNDNKSLCPWERQDSSLTSSWTLFKGCETVTFFRSSIDDSFFYIQLNNEEKRQSLASFTAREKYHKLIAQGYTLEDYQTKGN